MTFRLRDFALATAFTLLVPAGTSCSKPVPPQLVPKAVQVTGVDLEGVDLRVTVDAFNPNSFELSVRSVSAHVVVNNTQDLGTVTSSTPITLPAGAHTLLDVPINVKWKGAAGFVTLAAAKRPVPYTIDGTAAVGGDRLNVDLPFKLEGTITPDQLQQAGVKSLQAIPGLQGIPGLTAPR